MCKRNNYTGKWPDNMVYVFFQFTFLFAIFFYIDYSRLGTASLALIVAGGLWGLWAIFTIGWNRVNILPDVKESTVFTRHGPYRFTRHPMYSALIFAGLGAVLTRNDIFSWALFAGLVLALAFKIRYEEQQLTAHFPEYKSYQKETKRVIPFIF